MRIAEAGGREKITRDGQQNFPQREVFFPQSPGVEQTTKKSLHLVMNQLLCYPIYAQRSPIVRGLKRGGMQQRLCQFWPAAPRSSV